LRLIETDQSTGNIGNGILTSRMSVPPEVHRVDAPAERGIAVGHNGWGFISIYAAAYGGTWLALLTPIMITLALRTRQLDPTGSEYGLSLVLAVGALFALIANPLIGWLSDRTTSAWGMRRPWLIGGALGAVGGAVVGDQLQSRDNSLDARDQEIAKNRELIEELKRRNLDVKETSRGVVVNLPDVLFEFNRSNLTSGARAKVRDIADILDRPNVSRRQVSIEGHTDSVGSDDYNLRLSQQRADSVASALGGDGVSDSRLHTKGFGKKYPIAPNKNSDGSDNPSGRAKNRRVEVIIEN